MTNQHPLKPIIMIGAGGHASVLADILLSQGYSIEAFISPDEINQRNIFKGIQQLRNDSDIEQFQASDVFLVNGIGIVPRSNRRQKIQSYYLDKGYQFISVVSDKAIVSKFSDVGEACQIFPGAVIQAGVSIGAYSIINTGALVEHDCQLGSFNHIAPNAVLCGGVITATDVFVGANATVLPNLHLDKGVIVGAGAVVKDHLQSNQTAHSANAFIAPSELYVNR